LGGAGAGGGGHGMSQLGAFFAATIEMSVPLGLAALGGTLSERAGVANIALEGTLLASAFGSVAGSVASGSALVGLVCGVLTGALFGLVHAALVLRGRIDAIVSGLALNLVAAGATRTLLRALYHSSANSPNVRGFSLYAPATASASAGLVRVLCDPLVWLFVGLTVVLARGLATTRWGLWVRASGNDPRSAYAARVPVAEVRLGAVVVGAAITGLGGVALAFSQHQFQAGMSGGRGFIALAAVIVSGWRPARAALACVAFAALEAAGFVLQDRGGALPAAFAVLPYAGTLVVLVLFARGRAFRAPAGLGVRHDD